MSDFENPGFVTKQQGATVCFHFGPYSRALDSHDWDAPKFGGWGTVT